jgi:predicted HTH domain antitoxin
MPKKQEKQAVVDLQQYMAKGHSFTRAAELAEVPLEKACKLITTRIENKKHNSAALDEAAHEYLVKALYALGGLAESCMVPAIKLAAAQSLITFFVQVDRMRKEQEAIDVPQGPGPIGQSMQLSLWNFKKGDV